MNLAFWAESSTDPLASFARGVLAPLGAPCCRFSLAGAGFERDAGAGAALNRKHGRGWCGKHRGTQVGGAILNRPPTARVVDMALHSQLTHEEGMEQIRHLFTTTLHATVPVPAIWRRRTQACKRPRARAPHGLGSQLVLEAPKEGAAPVDVSVALYTNRSRPINTPTMPLPCAVVATITSTGFAGTEDVADLGH